MAKDFAVAIMELVMSVINASPHYDLHHCDSNNVHVINFYNHINY